MLRKNDSGVEYLDLSDSDSKPWFWQSGEIDQGLVSAPYTDHGLHHGTVYAHGMLGTNLVTNRMIVLVKHGDNDIREHFASVVERQPDRDYEPYVKTANGDYPMSDRGTQSAPLHDENYDNFGIAITIKSAKYTVPANTMAPYVNQALRLRLSGSDKLAVIRYIADKLVDDFWGDTLPITVTLPESKQRSKTGELTADDKRRKKAFDDVLVELSSVVAPKIVNYAFSIKGDSK